MSLTLRLKSRLATLILLASLFLFTMCSPSGEGVPRIIISDDFQKISVDNISSSVLNDLTKGQLEKSSFLVYVLNKEGAVSSNQLPIVGNYETVGSSIQFTPTYSFSAANSYLVKFKNGEEWMEETFDMPRLNMSPVTSVEQIYPSSELLPRNILKFYMQFTDSMAQRFSYQNIALLDARGDTVRDAFLELEEELWSPDMKRFTLLLDPGRIKRGLGSQEDLGYTFRTGSNYSLLINASWLDAWGRELTNNFRKDFTIKADDRTKPDLNAWQIEAPKASSNDALTINFNEPMDFGLASRLVQILNEQEQPVEGTYELSNAENSLVFRPSTSWTSGNYKILVGVVLEDLAGNNLKNLFDVDNQTDNTSISDETHRLISFTVN